MIGYTPDRFRYEVVWPNSPLRPARPKWEPLTWAEVTSRLYAIMEDGGDPVFEIRIVTIDPNIRDDLP
jgi:hypothetical protein